MKELSEDGSEDSSDNLSDSQSRENNGGAISQEGRRGRWMRRGTVHCKHQSSCCDVCGLPGQSTHNSLYLANFKAYEANWNTIFRFEFYRSFSNKFSYSNCKKKQYPFLCSLTVTPLGRDSECKRPLRLEVAAEVQEARQSAGAVESSWMKLACRLQGLTIKTTPGEHCFRYDVS